MHIIGGESITMIGRRNVKRAGANLIGAVAELGSAEASQDSDQEDDIGGATTNKNIFNLPRPSQSILDHIGNTSLLELHNIVPKGHARIFVKLESENPSGSMKDRMALAMIEAAEADGRLKPGGRVAEYTGGSTGVSLSLVCRVRGYPLDIVSSDAFSSEKLNHMAALGADLVIIKSISGGMDEALTRNMIAAAKQIQEEKGSFLTDQLSNADVLPRYHDMGEEIWRQTGGKIDAFVQGVGTGGSLRGVAEYLIQHNPDMRIVAVEPSESAVLSGEKEGSHKIEGIGAGFVVPLWKPKIVDNIVKTSTEDALAMARRLANEEGIFAGTSTGSNVIAALQEAKALGPEGTVVTVVVDTGIKYLSTALYKRLY
jgi:cysteine synthase A